MLGEWAGFAPGELEGTSIYGIRRYWKGAVLRPHADRGDVLVISAILNVDQSEDLRNGSAAPWELEVFDHEMRAHYVTMAPGDVVFYESAAAVHARPYPLQGEYYANIFMHLKPASWDYKGFQTP